MSRDDTDETTKDGVTRRAFAQVAAIGVGALSLPGLAAAHRDNRSEQGERNGNNDNAHGNGNGRGRGHDEDDDPGNSGEHRSDDEGEEDNDDEGEAGDGNGENGDDGDGGDGGDGGGGDGDGGGDSGDAQVTARRDEDSSAFVLPEGPGTDTAQFDLVVEQASQPVFIRDQFPSDWTVVEGDPHMIYTKGNTRFVEFTNRVEKGDTRTYFADVPDNTGADEFGPIEYSVDGETWTEITGTTEEIVVAAAGTSV